MQEAFAQVFGRHALHLHRYGTGTINKILKEIDGATRRATGEIYSIMEGMTDKERADFVASNFRARRVIALRDSLNQLATDVRTAAAENTREDGKDLARYEVELSETAMATISTVPSYTQVTASAAYSAAISRPYLGSLHREWLADQSRSTRREVMGAIRTGFLASEGIQETIRRIRGTKSQNYSDGIMGGAVKHRITRLVRTSQNHLANVAREENLLAMGVDSIQLRATLDGRTSKICAARDLEIWPINEGPRPPFHPNCRTTVEPYIEEFEGVRPFVAHNKPISKIKKSDRVVGTIKANDKFGVFFGKQSAEFQREWLGPTRYKLYKSGKFPIDRLVDFRTNRAYTIDQLRRLDQKTFKDLGL